MSEEPPRPAAPPQSEPPPTIDDEIYEKLIEHPEDVQGLLAYGIFRQSERDWIKRFHGRSGRTPTDREITEQFYFSYDDGDIRRLRADASDHLVKFAVSVLDDERPEIEEGARKAAHDAQLEDLRAAHEHQLGGIRREIRQSGSLWRAVLAGIISSLVFAVLTILFVAIYFAPGLRDITKGLGH